MNIGTGVVVWVAGVVGFKVGYVFEVVVVGLVIGCGCGRGCSGWLWLWWCWIGKAYAGPLSMSMCLKWWLLDW